MKSLLLKIILASACIIMAPFSAFGQRVVLEYFEGQNIVLYTHEYRLSLREDIRPGLALSAGAVIETGAKTRVELRIEPSGSVVKLSENSTLKVMRLTGYGNSDTNELKLISGTMRAIVAVHPGEKPVVFSGELTDCEVVSADFGMVVRKKAEESVIVLAGSVDFAGSRERTIEIRAGEMANEYDLNFRARPTGTDYLAALGALDFKGIRTVPSIKKDAETDSYITLTAPPASVPTPESDGNAAGSAEAADRKSDKIDRSSNTEDPREDTKGALQINGIDSDSVIVRLEPESEGSLGLYRAGEIYNIYRKYSSAGKTPKYSDFIDAVYLKEIRTKELILIFAFMSPGARKGLEPGFFLQATGRMFTPIQRDSEPTSPPPQKEPDPDQTVTKEKPDEASVTIEQESPAKAAEIEKSTAPADTGTGISDAKTEKVEPEAPAGETPAGNAPNDFFLGLEAGISVTVPYFIGLDIPPEYQSLALLFILINLRGCATASVYVKPLPFMGIGIEGGVAYMTMSDSTDNQQTFIDVLARGFLRFGSKGINISLFGGYYFTIINFIDLSGIEAGARISFASFNIECAYVFGIAPYLRFGIGYSFSFLPGML